jgi:hypothetical protein
MRIFSAFLKANEVRRKKSDNGPFSFGVEVFRSAKQIHFFRRSNLENKEAARWPLPMRQKKSRARSFFVCFFRRF